ncbi:uncharacterized protein [Eleutherodactylus coqui]|uniref:Uncharacterized protein n=2 Tax=Eleutherodactylus coqui TaxID=57060 RepID=A0A8J6BKE7_ELECQ|nr:hypothetical protein GDO78_019898 [Eleutherodactylus coqui]KAG9464463.1 hypothetical protein GDO78_019898 [Eleutherodactylus coqui]
MALTMYSRTTSALFFITVCTSAFWNVKATTTGVSPTEGPSHSAASISTENLPPNTPVYTAGETTFSPVLTSSPNSTFNNKSSTVMHSTEVSLVTTPTPVKNSPEAGSTTSALPSSYSSIAAHLSSTVITSTTLLSSVAASKKEDMSSTANKINNSTAVLPDEDTLTPQSNSTTLPVEPNTTLVSDENWNGIKYSEVVLTSIFSTILVVVLLAMLAFCFIKYRKRRSQYCHRPLCENVYEAEVYSPPDDTLVISGGLYDAPRIYNPNMTVLEEEDPQPDYVSFSSRPGQFRLEFLPGDKDMNPPHGSLQRNV